MPVVMACGAPSGVCGSAQCLLRLLVDVHEFVLLTAQTQFLGIADDVRAVEFLDSAHQGGVAVAGGVLVVKHEVESGAVERHGVG